MNSKLDAVGLTLIGLSAIALLATFAATILHVDSGGNMAELTPGTMAAVMVATCAMSAGGFLLFWE